MNPNRCVDLYRYFDSSGRLLYVGISNSAFARSHQHRRKASWWDLASSMVIEHHPDRERALIAEAHAIVKERPIYNVALNGQTRRALKMARTRTLDQLAAQLGVRVSVLDQYLATGALRSSHASGEYTDRDIDRFMDTLEEINPRRRRKVRVDNARLYRCCGVPDFAGRSLVGGAP